MTVASCAKVRLIEGPWRDPMRAAAGAASQHPWSAALLGTADGDGWSYVAAAPTHTLRLHTAGPGEAHRALRDWIGPPSAMPLPPGAPPFCGGVIGVAGFGLGVGLEPSLDQTRDGEWPDLLAALYPSILAFDHRRGRVVAIGRGATDAEAAGRAQAALDIPDVAPPRHDGPFTLATTSNVTREDYCAAVARVVDAISRGDIFQTNIARDWHGRLAAGLDPLALFARLHHRSPAPYAAWWKSGAEALVSNSPERFLEIRRTPAGLIARTQPIKGTRPRNADPLEDARLAAELEASAKDRAENLMIVDLMRNDLSRHCDAGSVKVERMCELQSFTNVHHLVSTVTGRLSQATDSLDLFLSVQPPGSVTGAPKVQAMRELARHETPRGAFCGSLFWAGFDGALDSSVLIRTVELTESSSGWRFQLRAGAGITADSKATDEADEVEAKADAVLSALIGCRS